MGWVGEIDDGGRSGGGIGSVKGCSKEQKSWSARLSGGASDCVVGKPASQAACFECPEGA